MIYSFNECNYLLDKMDNLLLKEELPLGYTELEKLPIRHFTLGKGNKHIVVSASQHSNEIISTTFVIKLMQYLIKNNIIYENLTIHFIPILNPEGYIVNTSAIRDKINSNISLEKTIEFCYDFYRNYKLDTLNKDTEFKLHQKMFETTDFSCIDKEYSTLRDNVCDILVNHPKGSIIDWASNGNGIDLNSNSVNKKVSELECNRQNQYNNIRLDIPSPIGYPGNNNSTYFQEEIEIKSLKKLFESLKDNLLCYLNYHSTGGIIFQRPEDNDRFITIYNYLLSKFYQEYTIKNEDNYLIITKLANKITSVNDVLRITYPGNILIELSPMIGNPIGVFGDIKNYINTIESNINSFIYTINNIEKIYKIASNLNKENILFDDIYPEIDKVYKKIRKQ